MNAVYLCDRMLDNQENEQNTATQSNMDKSKQCNVEWKKPNMKVCDSI